MNCRRKDNVLEYICTVQCMKTSRKTIVVGTQTQKHLLITLTCSVEPARPLRYQRKGSSRRVSRYWRHNPSNHRRTHCSWSWTRGRCKSCTSGPDPRHSRERTAACSGYWARTGRTCSRPGSRGWFGSQAPRQRPARAASTASRRARWDAGWSRRSRPCGWSTWARAAGTLVWPRCDSDRAGSRRASTTHRGRSSFSGLARAWSSDDTGYASEGCE